METPTAKRKGIHRQLRFLLVQAVKFLDRGARTGVLDGGLIVFLSCLLLRDGLRHATRGRELVLGEAEVAYWR